MTVKNQKNNRCYLRRRSKLFNIKAGYSRPIAGVVKTIKNVSFCYAASKKEQMFDFSVLLKMFVVYYKAVSKQLFLRFVPVLSVNFPKILPHTKNMLLFTCVHSNWQKSMKIACGDGIFALWPSLPYGQRGKRTDLPEQ